MRRFLVSLLRWFPYGDGLLKRVKSVVSPPRNVSSNYVEVQSTLVGAESSRLRGAWQDDTLPAKQRQLVKGQLVAYRNGAKVDVFDVLVSALSGLPADDGVLSVLEVGCSSGYYSEVFSIAGLNVDYTGADYSPAFVALARQSYPALTFDIEDAAALRYATDSFDVVISGCCLLHIPEYEAAVAETARVARSYAVFHRTPVLPDQPNRYFRKLAYDVETVEIHFNEPQFLALLRSNGLELMRTWTLSEDPPDNPTSAMRTYLCRVT